jgi:hypothetical protein
MSLFGEPGEPSLEARRFAQETADRARELDIREREVAAKEEELKRSRWLNPTVIGLFAAALGLIGSVVVARVNNANTQEVQRLQSEANITLEAIKTGTGNTDAACKNLIFFVSLGLIRDSGEKIETQCKGAPAGPPSLPTGQTRIVGETYLYNGKVVDAVTGKGIVGALVTISSEIVATTPFRIYSDNYGYFSTELPFSWGAFPVTVDVKKDGYSENILHVGSGGGLLILMGKAP